MIPFHHSPILLKFKSYNQNHTQISALCQSIFYRKKSPLDYENPRDLAQKSKEDATDFELGA